MLMGFTMPVRTMATLFYNRVQNSLTKNLYGRRNCSSFGYWDPAQFRPKKAVILTKVSILLIL